MTVLLREAIGDRLRHARTNQRRTLREVSRSARVSLGYLSEVERGRKEASSELLSSICDALELPLSELLHHVASDIGAHDSVPAAVPAPVEAELEPAMDSAALADFDELERLDELDDAIDGGRIVPAVIGDNLADLRIQPALSRRIDPRIANSVFAA